jgi:hypothetical protein
MLQTTPMKTTSGYRNFSFEILAIDAAGLASARETAPASLNSDCAMEPRDGRSRTFSAVLVGNAFRCKQIFNFTSNNGHYSLLTAVSRFLVTLTAIASGCLTQFAESPAS